MSVDAEEAQEIFRILNVYPTYLRVNSLKQAVFKDAFDVATIIQKSGLYRGRETKRLLAFRRLYKHMRKMRGPTECEEPCGLPTCPARYRSLHPVPSCS